ncbi:hypothetical protein BJG93_19595 [Paraburkholderia sprentiae WSM5005]|uniref:Uncharacterized protein n=1 Tax=Paraburkholderia sprentiae WSM5005 TaxID=754502 RepID=A0A1I9YMZ3_9BURK|nr:hypothetical protein [Paraburkholderia sprentiae]APA87676.1 hypothetical protein BJG93_19595 [Paraburkholderia sprentiae WSM5005]
MTSRDDHKLDGYVQSLTLVSMIEGTAPRPYVYRSTFAKAAKYMAGQLNPALQHKLFKSISRYDSLHRSYFSGVPDSYWTPTVAVTYHIVYFFVVLSMALALLLIYKLARMRGLSFGQALGFLAGFSFIYPLTFQAGAYYYDFIEILGVFSACYFMLKRWMIPCTLAIAFFLVQQGNVLSRAAWVVLPAPAGRPDAQPVRLAGAPVGMLFRQP